MDEIETKFQQSQEFQPLMWFRYIDDVFVFGPMVQINLCHLWQILITVSLI